MENLNRTASIALAGLMLISGSAWAQSPHETYHRFHDRGQHHASGKVLYVQPSYPFTRYYVNPGQNPATIPHHQSGPSRKFHRFHHRHGLPKRHHHYDDNHYGHGHGYHDRPDYGYGRKHATRNRIVQDGSRLSLYDENNRAIRQIYLRPGSSWERQFGRVIVRSRSRLEVYDQNLHRVAGMYLPVGASYSFRRDGIVVKTRFYTEIYDYNLQRLDRYRS